ncbi:hypothetical protein QFZ67_001797 [Streptomyces sp. V1I1]|nr:hypothetical protein [Streptomyces sp. V1I1]
MTTVRKAIQEELLERRPRPPRGFREDLGAEVGGLLLVGRVEAGGPPYFFAHLDDDGAGIGGVRIAVQLHDTVLGLGDLEAEGVEGEVGGEPDVAAAVGGDVRRECVGVRLAGEAVHPVRRDDQVVRGGEFGGGRGWGAEAEAHAEGFAAPVQYLQQATSPEGGEAVPAGGEGAVAVDDVDVVPPYELVLERAVDDGVGVLDPAESLVGEDDAEAEGVVGGVALPDGDVAFGAEPLEQRGGIQPTGPTADDGHAEGASACLGRGGRRPAGLGDPDPRLGRGAGGPGRLRRGGVRSTPPSPRASPGWGCLRRSQVGYPHPGLGLRPRPRPPL